MKIQIFDDDPGAIWISHPAFPELVAEYKERLKQMDDHAKYIRLQVIIEQLEQMTMFSEDADDDIAAIIHRLLEKQKTYLLKMDEEAVKEDSSTLGQESNKGS